MTESQRKTLQDGEIIRVEIEKIAHGGHFIARHQGAVIFIRLAIPGEIVEVTITKIEKSFLRGDVVAVIEPSPHRVAPPCKYSGVCGGCDFQHIDLAHQRHLKSDVIAEQFARIAKMEIDVEVEEVSTPLNWRTRYSASTDSRGVAGFKASRSNAVVPITTCPILVPEIDFATLPREKFSAQQRVDVAISTSGSRSIAISPAREDRAAERAKPALIEGERQLNYEVNDFDYQVSQQSFWQSNFSAPQTLVDVVLDFASLKSGDHILDLYGGVGLFAGAALKFIGPGGRVDIIEGSASATADAAINFKDFRNVFIHTGDVGRELTKVERADIVILDPPRTGAGRDVIDRLTKIAARAIIYVACDPAALARDTAFLKEAGYHLEQLRSFDLFPMTHHIESVALYTLSEVS